MAKNGVDGVYTADPAIDPHARRYTQLNFREAIAHNVGIMDTAALSLCEENQLPILVFDIAPPDAIVRAVVDGHVGTLVGAVPTQLARRLRLSRGGRRARCAGAGGTTHGG